MLFINQLIYSYYSNYTTIKINENYDYIIISYYNNNHFCLIYRKKTNYLINNNADKLKKININNIKKINIKENINIIFFSNKYVK